MLKFDLTFETHPKQDVARYFNEYLSADSGHRGAIAGAVTRDRSILPDSFAITFHEQTIL